MRTPLYILMRSNDPPLICDADHNVIAEMRNRTGEEAADATAICKAVNASGQPDRHVDLDRQAKAERKRS